MTGKDAVSSSSKSGLLSRWLFAALVIAGLVFLAIQLAPQTIGETARRHLLKELQRHYPDSRVSIRRGSYQSDIGLIFEGIKIFDSNGHSSSDWNQSVHIEKLVAVADLVPNKLVTYENPLVSQKLVIDGIHLNASMDRNGNLSLSKLWPPPQLGPCTPRIEVHNAEVRLTNGVAHHPLAIQLNQVLLTKDPASGDQSIAATGTAPFLGAFQVHSKVTPQGISIRGTVRDARLNDDLFARLPIAYATALQEARGFDGLVDATIDATCLADGSIDYLVRTTINSGRIDHPMIPKAVSQLGGLVTFEPQGIEVKSLHGKFGDALFRAKGIVDPKTWPNNAAFNLSGEGLLLDANLASRLPDALRVGWDKLQPYGQIDIETASLRCQNGRWKSNAVVYAKGVNVRYEKMPYPAEQLVGRVELLDGIATCYEMTGRVGGRHMRCAFRLPISPEVTKEKVFRIQVDGPIAIDNTLIDALKPRGTGESNLESFVRSLHPQGAVHVVDAQIKTDAAGVPSRSFDLQIVNGHLRYEKFPYPLYNVSGKVTVTDDLVWLKGFEANDSSAGQVNCDGWYRMPPPNLSNAVAYSKNIHTPSESLDDRPIMQLRFDASQIAMDGALRSSLPNDTKIAWDAISPSGVLDQLDVTVTRADYHAPVTTDITAVQHDTDAVTNRALSLQPPALPYRLDVLGGNVRFDGRDVLIESIRTQHDATRVAADGKCVRGRDGRWNLMLNIQSGSRLHPDAELIAALPDEMREAMHRLQLRGPLSVRGTTQILLADAKSPEPVVNWDLSMQLEGNRLGDVGPVHSVRGELTTTGTSDQGGLRSIGEVEIDSMHVNDLHLTSIKGPFMIDGDRLYLGTQIGTETTKTNSQEISGRVFDGDVGFSGEVILSSGKFSVAASLRNGQVPTLLSDLGQGRSELSGAFNIQTQLEGFLGTTELLKGSGSANLSDANLYQLPLLVQLLNLLRITPTEDVAFTDGNAIFQIVENELNFNTLQLWGDLVALDGAGTLNRRHELDLTFNTRVSPHNSFTRVVRPIYSGKYTLLTVDVRGPIGSPMINRRTFDGVSETLEKLFPVMSEANQDRKQQAKSWWPSILK